MYEIEANAFSFIRIIEFLFTRGREQTLNTFPLYDGKQFFLPFLTEFLFYVVILLPLCADMESLT